MDEPHWRKLLNDVGGEHNPDGLWPVPHDGFKALAERARMQDERLKNERDFVDAVQADVRRMNRFRGAQLAERVSQVVKTHAEQQHRMLRVMHKLEALEARYHASQGGASAAGVATTSAADEERERELAARLRRLQGALNRSATSLPRRVDALGAARRAEQIADASRAAGGGGGGGGAGAKAAPAPKVGAAFAGDDGGAGRTTTTTTTPDRGGRGGGGPIVDDAAAAAYDKIISEQAEATRHLAEVLKKDLRDVAVLKRERAAMAERERQRSPMRHAHDGGGAYFGGQRGSRGGGYGGAGGSRSPLY